MFHQQTHDIETRKVEDTVSEMMIDIKFTHHPSKSGR